METNFNFKSQICTDREQSERLLALGLKKETADMGIYYSELYGVDRVFSNDVFDETPTFDSDEIPAWSLYRLIEMIPMYFKETKIEIRSEAVNMAMKDGNLYDNLIDIIVDCIKEGFFNKEYLEEKNNG